MAEETAPLEEEDFGPTTLWYSATRGRYPEGNSLLVRGAEEQILIDPSLCCIGREDKLPGVDRMLLSHCHEDHIAGIHLMPETPIVVHSDDRPGLEDLDGMMAIYGFPEKVDGIFRKAVEEQFHYVPRPDAQSYEEGDVFDLGGGVSLTIHHTPGHTRGHCCPLVESAEGRVLYLGDIDLSGFGPYYGDAWSDLEDFERSLAKVRDIEADWYVTFHHIGAVDRETFLTRLDKFSAMIGKREGRLLEYLAEPRTMADIVEHRFIYRPGDAVGFADPVEERSMSLHITRLTAAGRVEETEPGRYRAA